MGWKWIHEYGNTWVYFEENEHKIKIIESSSLKDGGRKTTILSDSLKVLTFKM